MPLGMNRSSLLRLVGLALLIVAVAAALTLLPLRDTVRAFLAWVEDLGPWGPVFLAAFYVPPCLLLIPGSLVTLAAGTLFGVPRGTVAVSIGSTLGASLAFLVGRTLARRWVERRVAGDARFQAVDQAIALRGFRVVFLLRLSPVFPFTLLNYTLGLTRVSFRAYVLASWIGMLPGTLMYVYLGSTLASLGEVFSRERGAGPEQAFFFAGLAVTVLVTVYITRVARRALHEAITAPVGEGAVGQAVGVDAVKRGA
jgi:uncharacterized membrane protein YdjX (TVP38/TMEM64 family)